MGNLWGDRTPLVDDVRPVLDLFAECAKGLPWHDALVQQISYLRGVAGSVWYADLIVEDGAPPLPLETPSPCAALNTREGINPWGTLLLWLDRSDNAISCIEYAAVEMHDVDHYPGVDELEIDPRVPSPSDLRRAARSRNQGPAIDELGLDE